MSKGSPYVPIRIPVELLREVEITMTRAAMFRRGTPWTRSSFIITAIREKIAKMERSRQRHNVTRRRPRPVEQLRPDSAESGQVGQLDLYRGQLTAKDPPHEDGLPGAGISLD